MSYDELIQAKNELFDKRLKSKMLEYRLDKEQEESIKEEDFLS